MGRAIGYPRRLLKLAALLEKDAKRKRGIKFDLGEWANTEGKKLTVSCGTTACAMGLAVLSGEFKRQGLSNYYIGGVDAFGQPALAPKCNRRLGFGAASELFGISDEMSEYLFSSLSYKKSKGAQAELVVAKRIRELVKTDGESCYNWRRGILP